jgi:hypothetical protein
MVPNNESSYNEWADFWRYKCGLNVFGVDTKSKGKGGCEKWSSRQDSGISEEEHNEKKRRNVFANGIAIMVGKVWHRPDLADYHICFIDMDNQNAIEEICKIFGVKDIDELARLTIVERHPDNLSKAHLYFYTKYVLKKKSSDAIRNLKDKLDSNEIPAIEVKCQSDGLAFCTPSTHQNGSNYEIIGTKEIGMFNGKEVEDKLFEVYEKYGLLVGTESNNGKTSKIPIEELLKPDFIIEAGHNRHEAVLRVIEHYYLKYREFKTLNEIYDICWKWNLNHCKPPLSQADFERQIKDGLKFVDKTNVSNNNQQTILLQRQNQYKQQLKTDSDQIYKIVSCLNNVPRAYYIDYNLGQICYGVLKDYGINLEKCIIDIAPKKIRYYKNPIFPDIEAKIELEFQEGNELRKIGPFGSITELLKTLENKGYILNRNKAADAFNSVVSAMKERGEGLVEYITDVTTTGYYFIDGKLVMKNVSQSFEEISKENAVECCNLLNILASGWKNKDIFPTVIKWGLMSPFTFIIKSNIEEYVPWLQLFGWGKSGKTTLGLLVYMIWNRSTKLKKGFSNIDSIPRLGETISKDTYPVLVNEVGSLYENGGFSRNKSIREIIKHGGESTTVRGKFIDNRYEEIPALSPLILTANDAPPNDGGFGRRFISIHFPKDEKKEENDTEEFKKLLDDKKQYLKVLGDFTSQFISKDPSMLLKDDWKFIAKRILIEFYQFADKEVPKWVEYFIEQKDAVDESSEKTQFALRAFLVNEINSAYSRNSNNSSMFDNLGGKLNHCLDHNLIPFLHRLTSNKGDDTDVVVITHDILDEINKGWNKIENITALTDIGVQLGFKYDGKYLNKRKTKVVFGPVSELIEFINPEIS